MSSTTEDLVEEFFRAPRAPATTHEEWLLRLCAQLMDREANAVSVLEAQAAQQQRPNRRRGRGWTASTAPSTQPTY